MLSELSSASAIGAPFAVHCGTTSKEVSASRRRELDRHYYGAPGERLTDVSASEVEATEKFFAGLAIFVGICRFKGWGKQKADP